MIRRFHHGVCAMMHIKILDPHGEKEWDECLLKNKYTEFLQSFCWAQLLEIAYGFKPVFWKFREVTK